MKPQTIRASITVFEAAQDTLEEALYEVLGPCHATEMLARMVRHPVGRGRAAFAESVHRKLPASTVHSAWRRSGAGSLKAFQWHILLYELRCVLEVPEVSFQYAALAIGGSSPQSVSRAVRLATGAPASALRRTTSAAHLAAWTALLREKRTALRRIRFPARAKAARRIDHTLMLMHRRELLRRELAQIEKRLAARAARFRPSRRGRRAPAMQAAA